MGPERAKARIEGHPLVKLIMHAATLLGALLLLLAIAGWLRRRV